MARRPVRLPRTVSTVPVGAPRISRSPPAYVRKWHAVHDWAREVLEPMDVTPYRFKGDRKVSGFVGSMVDSLLDIYEAGDDGKARPLDEIDLGPSWEVPNSGNRRVAIRAWVWEYEPDFGNLDSPTWITLGRGWSARTAHQRAKKWLKEYIEGEQKGTVSRILRFTALEVVFWTAGPKAGYV